MWELFPVLGKVPIGAVIEIHPSVPRLTPCLIYWGEAHGNSFLLILIMILNHNQAIMRN